MQSRQKGFTLIELVVVIVILGILAATALPKFIDLSTDARAAVIQGVEGSMRSANSMIYAKAATANLLSGAQTTLTIPGVTGTIGTTNGFATSTTDLAKAMDLDSSKIDSATAGSVFYKGYAVGTCGVAYTASTGPGIAPIYVTKTAGC